MLVVVSRCRARSFFPMQLLDDPVETGKMYTSLSDTVRNVKNVTVDVYDKSDGMKSLKGFTPFPVSFQ